MVLDPLSAFSVACNVIQVIETGCKILSTASDYRKAADGAPREQRELRGIARTLENLSKGLQTSLSSSAKSDQISPEEIRLIDANNECLKVSKEFIDLLDRLRVKNQHATIESLHMSIKARWYKDRIDTLKQALSEARNNLNIAFLLYMHSEQVSSSQQIEDAISHSTDKVEQNVLTAVNSSSVAMQDEIRDLAEQLTETYLDSEEKTVSGFMSLHQETLDEILAQIKAAVATQDQSQSSRSEDRTFAANQNILASLYYQQIHDRQDQVQNAYSSTYQWMLQSLNEKWQHWDCFSTWLQSSKPQSQLYWIHGKPGSGKSTLMKFLDNNISIDEHTGGWAQGMPVLKAVCYFWASGSSLQKSLGGLYRSLLLQLFEQEPTMISQVVSTRKWKVAELSGAVNTLEWTNSELRTTLENLINRLQPTTKVFFLIDGLDEFEGADEEQEYLAHFLCDLGTYENVKICVSSRPLVVFQDALRQCPQLRLEDLTHDDIQLVVTSQLEQNSRFRFFEKTYPDESKSLVAAIISKASGVFLWVRLVLRDFLRALRDGDGLRQLQRRLDLVPVDLNSYFFQIIESIQPEYQREASTMLQLALYEETEFASKRPLFLSDVSFTESLQEDVADMVGHRLNNIGPSDRQSLVFHIDSAYRKLNSRCVGLLECVQSDYLRNMDPGKINVEGKGSNDLINASTSWNLGDDITTRLQGTTDTVLWHLLNVKIELFHRTLRDFLLTSSMQEHLQGYTDGPLDARAFLCNTRANHFIALIRAGVHDKYTTGLAGNLLSMLSVDRSTRTSADIATRIENAMVRLANDYKPSDADWSIGTSLRKWSTERSNFLTLAIDFRLSSYVVPRLTRAAIKDKSGRPILDYILRPRFRHNPGLKIANRFPDAEFLIKALESGADPNEVFKVRSKSNPSIWALFLCSYRDMVLHYDSDEDENLAYLAAMNTLVNAGPETFLSHAALCVPQQHDYHPGPFVRDYITPRHELFRQRWPSLEATAQCPSAHGVDDVYALSDVLECFRSQFGSGMHNLVQLSKRKEAESLRRIHRPFET